VTFSRSMCLTSIKLKEGDDDHVDISVSNNHGKRSFLHATLAIVVRWKDMGQSPPREEAMCFNLATAEAMAIFLTF
jgi:hypothetical protein